MDLVRAEEWFATTSIGSDETATDPLIVPQSAVLRTGNRGVVYVQTQSEPAPRFEGRTVELGPSGEGFIVVREGLSEGELVVRRGNFQIDSALQIQAKPSMMNLVDESAGPDGQAAMSMHHLEGPPAESIRSLVMATYRLNSALVEEDISKAEQAAAGLDDASAKLRETEMPTELAQTIKALAESVEGFDGLGDVEKYRSQLDLLSQSLIDLLQNAHVEDLGAVYRAYCPMAFDNRGASWITPEEIVLNPYFGDRMLRCGSIEETLSKGDDSADDGKADPHTEHSH
jgi:Cu(I)/Ag(I) efflux system membrane fusion protein